MTLKSIQNIKNKEKTEYYSCIQSYIHSFGQQSIKLIAIYDLRVGRKPQILVNFITIVGLDNNNKNVRHREGMAKE